MIREGKKDDYISNHLTKNFLIILVLYPIKRKNHFYLTATFLLS